jgi:hypothetical protein
MAAVIAAGVDPDAPETRDERFEFGLDCLLDGIEARIPPLAQAGLQGLQLTGGAAAFQYSAASRPVGYTRSPA